MGVLSFLFGLLAVALALRAERARTAPLGATFVRRIWLVQGLVINLVVMLVVAFSLQPLQGRGLPIWLLVAGAYGLGFYFYSRSNIRWAIAKFHAEAEPSPPPEARP